MTYPEQLLYTEDHEWVKIDGDIATVGITAFAQSELGDVVYVEVETTGESLSKSDVFGSIEAVKTVSDLFMPISGEVVEFNDAIEAEPELLNNDPYGKGWIIKIKMSNSDDTTTLLDAKSYQASLS